MNRGWKPLALAFASIAALFVVCGPSRAEDQSVPQIKAVPLDPGGQSYIPLLKGPPETKSFHSGLVILAPGKSVGAHSTGTNEEMLVPLEGQGELRFANHPPILLKPGLVTYAPPHTEHDVVNTSSAPLRYIYITAKTE